ncbi:hypothetical protein Theam_1105 [Thermovibrio ammonificans HB-1]|uniref:Uncharacterized protein n=1 Tax=Thermovibrio ammonificans (strain DSM 15698 / JCM 12110 / HB-1) TaxID=648996 RepID=E8T2H6_THEA1|nr:hypothetical protein [Thermovibrio ammonificans]ADU97071.1 hypothetical protein Theam_1105 [Thermovibrio ammonificans HB-1]
MKRWGSVLLVISLFVAACVSGYYALQSYVTYKIAQKLNRRLERLPYPVSYGSFSYKLLGNDLVLKDLKVGFAGNYITVDKVVIDLPFDFRKKGVPSFTRVSVYGLHVPTSLPLVKELALVSGLSSPFLNLNTSAGFSFNGRELTVNGGVVVKGLAAFTGEVKLDNISRDYTEKLLERRVPYSSALVRVKLKLLDLRYRDYGFFNRFIGYTARQEGLSPQEVKAELVKTLRGSFSANPEFARRLGYALIDFIANPSCFELVVRPQPPVSLLKLEQFAKKRPQIDRLMKVLNVKGKVCG